MAGQILVTFHDRPWEFLNDQLFELSKVNRSERALIVTLFLKGDSTVE